MELKLNIYDGREIEKTYTASECDIMFGTVEDFIALVDTDKLSESASDKDLIVAVTKLLCGGLGEVKTLLKDVFVGVTDDELKRTKMSELVPILVRIVKFSFAEIMSIVSTKK